MDSPKDYYATLGVLSNAEDIIIRAAYRALAQRYHPDRYKGAPDESNRLMAEINEAFSVLSDPQTRAHYDTLRGSGTQSGDAYFGANANDSAPRIDPLERDWAVAVSYYPDLVELNARPAKKYPGAWPTRSAPICSSKRHSSNALVWPTTLKHSS